MPCVSAGPKDVNSNFQQLCHASWTAEGLSCHVDGSFGAAVGSPDWALMDTNGDGVVNYLDDPLTPYYPGDCLCLL